MSRPAHAFLTLWVLFSLAVMPLGQAWSALPPVAGFGDGAHTEMAMGVPMDEHCSGCLSGEACFACHCAAAFFPIPLNSARPHADLSTESIPVPVDPAYTSLEPSPLYRPPKA